MYKVNVLDPVTHLKRACILVSNLVHNSQSRYKKTSVLIKTWTLCSKHDHNNSSKFNRPHNWGDLYDHLLNTRIQFTFIMNQTFVWAAQIMRKVAMASIWICQPSHINLMFHIPREAGYSKNITISRPIYLNTPLKTSVLKKNWTLCSKHDYKPF